MDECKKLDIRLTRSFKVHLFRHIKHATIFTKNFISFLLLLHIDFQRMNGNL
jgi:hypothetical protein